jgi:hypothetical protein
LENLNVNLAPGRSCPPPSRSKRPSPPIPTPPSRTSRARKDRQPNWSQHEISALIAAKREFFLEELDALDGQDLMNPEASKWMRVSQHVMRAGHSPCMRDGPACKAKWNLLLPDYKRIADFHARTGRNGMDYWELYTLEHTSEGLPKTFSRELYDQIHEWFGQRPQIQPPHIRDLLSPNDGNHPGVHALQESDNEGSGESQPETKNPATTDVSDSLPLPSPPSSQRQPS